jgi:hypothetical protein
MPGYDLFISYSRQQFYFAESLAVSLEKQGFSVWFDLQQLAPGMDWKQGIDEGLAASERCILIASQSALSSSYVQAEWETILKAGKPLYVVVYEPFSLPANLSPELREALRCAPTVDVRQDFNRGVSRLVDCIRTGSALNDPVPGPNRWNVPTRLPRSIWLVTVALLGLAVEFAILFVAMTFNLDQTQQMIISPATLPAAGIVGYLWVWWHFIHHENGYQTVRTALSFGLVGVLGTCALPLVSPTASTTVNRLLLGGAVMFLILWLAVFLVIVVRSADLLRWFPVGQAPQWLRFHVNGIRQPLLRPRASQETAKKRTVKLHFAPNDERLGSNIKNLLPHFQSVESAQQAEVHIALLSDFTPRKMVFDWLAAYGQQMICTVVTAVNLPEEVKQYQYIDMRGQSPFQTEMLADMLAQPDLSQKTFSLYTVPQKLDKLVAPQMVNIFANSLRLFGAGTLSLAVFSIMLILAHLPPYSEQPALYLLLALCHGAYGTILLWDANLILKRRIRLPVALLLWAGFPILFLLTAVITGASLSMALKVPDEVRNVAAGSAVNSALLAAALLALFTLVFSTALWKWLPVASKAIIVRPEPDTLYAETMNRQVTNSTRLNTLVIALIFIVPMIAQLIRRLLAG